MNLSFNLSDNVHKIIGLVCSCIIEILLLGYYAAYDLGNLSSNYDKYKALFKNPYESDIQTFQGLSITGSLLLITTLGLQIMLIYKYNPKILYLIFGINTCSIILLIAGVGIISDVISEVTKKALKSSDPYNTPLAFWFIQLCLYILSLVNLHNLKNLEGNGQNEDTNKKKEVIDDSKKQAQNTSTQSNQSQMVMMGNNESQFTQQQQGV
ncbi:unnamed protein product [Paramecium primaurelia]|uniref:Uncharacterized protein n=1 Tax=Paramecium primaurelia TaxID=5886 RepID=A0A8S1P653_PARPR|nr:unnamed protein product [Paramecium primaurelia]